MLFENSLQANERPAPGSSPVRDAKELGVFFSVHAHGEETRNINEEKSQFFSGKFGAEVEGP